LALGQRRLPSRMALRPVGLWLATGLLVTAEIQTQAGRKAGLRSFLTGHLVVRSRLV